VDLPHFWRLLVADAGFDEDDRGAGADDDGVHAEEDAVELVGWDALLPERFGHDAEHGPAVEEVGAVGAEGEGEVAEGHIEQVLGFRF
jgi:hypothetical protein